MTKFASGRKLKSERFILPAEHSFYDLYEQRAAENIGERINIALDNIEEKNKAKLRGVFRNIDFNSEANFGETRDRNRRLKMLLESFNKPELDMRPTRVSEDVIGNTYIYLIERFASDAGKKAGEFYTPHKVSELVAKLCAPKPGARICDPACGSAGLLIEAARVVGSANFFVVWNGSERQHLGVGANEYVFTRRRFGAHRMVQHADRAQVSRKQSINCL